MPASLDHSGLALRPGVAPARLHGHAPAAPPGDMERTRRSLWNYLSSMAFSLVTIAVALAATPLLLRFLGEERFGAFRAASDWGGYLGLLELGLGGALLPMLARAIARSDGPAVATIMATGIRSYLGVAAMMLIGAAGLALAIPWLVPVSAAVAADLRCGCWIGVLCVLWAPLAPFRALLEAGQRAYLVHSLLIVQSLLITSLALLLAWRHGGITGQYVAILIGALPFYAILLCQVGRYHPHLFRGCLRCRPDPQLQQELWRLNWPTLLVNLCGRVSFLTDNILVAACLGSRLVVPFFITQRLALLVQSQLQGIGNASWAALADLRANDQGRAFNERLLELTQMVAVLGVACLVPGAAFNRHFIHLWMGPERYGGDGVTILAAVNGFLLALFSLWGWAFSGTGKVARLAPVLVCGATINLVLSVFCTLRHGLVGPLLGTLAAFLATSLWWLPWLLYREFGTSPWSLLRSVGWPLAWGVPFAAGVWWLARMHEPLGWLGLAAEMAASAGTYLLLAWWFVLEAPARILWLKRVRLLLKRGGA